MKTRRDRCWLWLLLAGAILFPIVSLPEPVQSFHEPVAADIHTLPPDSAEQLIHIITNLCSSRLLDGLCFGRLDGFPPPSEAGGVIDANVCAELPAATVEHQDLMPVGTKCVTRVNQPDGTYQFNPIGVPDDRCFDAIHTQRLCRENAVRRALGVEEMHTSCIPGFEINCRRFLPAEVSQAIQQGGAPVYPAIATACSGITVGNVGYSDLTTHRYEINRTCLQAPNNGHGSSAFCTFLGQQIQVDKEFCQVLTSCVEPQLNAAYATIGRQGNAPIYAFPSGDRALSIDLSCSTSANQQSLHNPQHGCRAIDINVHDNYGNLRPETLKEPITNMPPEFVAVMEGCNVIWGGRYQRAEGVPGGCDPMEFSYAPACEIRGYSYWLDRSPATQPDTVMDASLLHWHLVTPVHIHPDMLTALISPFHPYWQAPEQEWWLHVRTLTGANAWLEAVHYRVASALELEYSGR